MSSNSHAPAAGASTATAVPSSSNFPSQQTLPFNHLNPDVLAGSQSTPTKRKLCGVQGVTYEKENGKLERANKEKHAIIGKTAINEIEDAMVEVEELIQENFPDEKTHFNPAELFKRLKKDHKIYTKGKWVKFEETKKAPSEPRMKGFLMRVLTKSKQIIEKKSKGKHKCKRHYSSVFYKNQVRDDVCDRKPDLVIPNASFTVKDINKGRVPDWRGIEVPIEIKKDEKYATEGLEQLVESARLIFKHQPNRRFVCGILIAGDEMTFCIFDRSGRVNAPTFNIHEHPELFLRVIVGLAFVERKDLGVDPTINLDGPKEDWKMTIKGKTYPILNIVHTESVVRGRGTVCYQVQLEDGRSALAKDNWVDMTREEREVVTMENLRKIEHRQHVPKVEDSEIVRIDGEYDTTARLRKSLLRKVVKEDGNEVWEWIDKQHLHKELRRHERILLTPFGVKIENFRSLEELLNSIKHIVLVIMDMKEIGILHRDISLRNVLLQDLDDRLQGLLIDYDYAIACARAASSAVGHRTGTVPFMAIEVLRSATAKHDYYHDLESLFYVLCWICTTQGGPSNTPRRFTYDDTELRKWNGDADKDSMEAVGDTKYAVMTSETDFIQRVTQKFDEYFKPIIECVMELRELLFEGMGISKRRLENLLAEKAKTGITSSLLPLSHHEPASLCGSFVSILQKAVDRLPEEHRIPRTKDVSTEDPDGDVAPVIVARKVAELKAERYIRNGPAAVTPGPSGIGKSKAEDSKIARPSAAGSRFVAPLPRFSRGTKRSHDKDEPEVPSTGTSKRLRTSVGSRRSARLLSTSLKEKTSERTSSNTSVQPRTPEDGPSYTTGPVRIAGSRCTSSSSGPLGEEFRQTK